MDLTVSIAKNRANTLIENHTFDFFNYFIPLHKTTHFCVVFINKTTLCQIKHDLIRHLNINFYLIFL